jgi:hypothetical protein
MCVLYSEVFHLDSEIMVAFYRWKLIKSGITRFERI